MIKYKKYLFLIGLILFALIISRLNFGQLISDIKNVNLFFLVVAGLLTFPLLLGKVWCWNYIKRVQGIRYKMRDSFMIYCASLFWGILTPGRMGEITRVFYLKKDGYSWGKSFLSTVFDRLADFFFLLLFASLGSLFFFKQFNEKIIWIIYLFLFLAIIILFFLKAGFFKKILKKLFFFIIPLRYQGFLKINFQDFIKDVKTFGFINYLVIFSITFFSWIFYYLQAYFLAQAVGIRVPIVYLSLAITIAGIITLLPISISGIGTRDAALVLLFVSFSLPLEQIIIFSNLILLVALFSSLIGFVCWRLKPLHF